MHTETGIGSFHINESLRYTGGAEGYVLNLATELDKRGIPVSIATGRVEETEPNRKLYCIPGIDEITSKTILTNNVDILSGIMEENGLSIVHLHNVDNPPLYPKLASKYTTVRTIIDSRAYCPTEFRMLGNGSICNHPLGKECLHCSSGIVDKKMLEVQRKALQSLESLDLLITPSQYTKDQLTLNGIAEKKIEVLPLFTPTIADDVLFDKKYESDILFVGRVVKSKGLREALMSFSGLGDNHTMTVCGDGPDLAACIKLADELCISHRVRFNGWTDGEEKAKHYKAAKIVIFPSIGPESFGLSGLEAMHFGKPVIGFNAGGVAEWLIDGHNGFAFEPRDTKGLTYGMHELLNNIDLREEMGANGKIDADEKFSIDRHIVKLQQIYKNLTIN